MAFDNYAHNRFSIECRLITLQVMRPPVGVRASVWLIPLPFHHAANLFWWMLLQIISHLTVSSAVWSLTVKYITGGAICLPASRTAVIEFVDTLRAVSTQGTCFTDQSVQCTHIQLLFWLAHNSVYLTTVGPIIIDNVCINCISVLFWWTTSETKPSDRFAPKHTAEANAAVLKQ